MKFKVAWIWIGWRQSEILGIDLAGSDSSRFKVTRCPLPGSSYKVPVKCSREGLISGHQETHIYLIRKRTHPPHELFLCNKLCTVSGQHLPHRRAQCSR